MTITATPTDRLNLLQAQLVTLRAERDQALAGSRAEVNGDVVDRATNVELSIRLQTLEERIDALLDEIELAQQYEHVDGIVSVGDTVTIDFGDGEEEFVIGSVEQAVVGFETITPSSPLGRALVGAQVGTTVSYQARRGVTLDVKVVAAR